MVSGTSRPWATRSAWATAIDAATSETTQAALRGGIGPSVPIRMSSEVPVPHSLTTYAIPSPWSASSTRSSRRSSTVAESRAASVSPGARSSSSAMQWRATCRSRTLSWARQNRPPPLSLSRSTSRYRSASTSPGLAAWVTVLPISYRSFVSS